MIPTLGTTISYVEFNTDVAISATTEASADTIVTAAAFTPNGADTYFIEFFAPGVQPGSSVGAQIVVDLYDNGNPISAGASMIAWFINPAAAVFVASADAKRRVTPSNASHTYSIRAHRAVANGTVLGTSTGTSQPGYVRIVKGP